MYFEHFIFNMHTYIRRQATAEIQRSLRNNPVTAIIGPRQCGKSTLARHLLKSHGNALLLDLELPSDMRKLSEPELFLREHAGELVCLDEVQMKPEIFPVLRSLVDRSRSPGRFLLLGSASRDLIRRGSETLAGRIHYVELTPFLFTEIQPVGKQETSGFRKLWWRGGFPPAYLAADETQSAAWRSDLIQDYLHRDIPQFGFSVPAPTMMRFWKMLAHYHGNILNESKLGQALGVSHSTIHRYLDLLEQTFMIRLLRPLETNLKKRLVKSPKVYLRDSGLLHSLLEIQTLTDLYGHPVFGASWEGWCIEQIITALPLWQPGFYRTTNGEEIDLVLQRGRKRLVFEIKASLSPTLSRGFNGTLEDLKPETSWVVCPLDDDKGYPLRAGVRAVGIRECLSEIASPGAFSS